MLFTHIKHSLLNPAVHTGSPVGASAQVNSNILLQHRHGGQKKDAGSGTKYQSGFVMDHGCNSVPL